MSLSEDLDEFFENDIKKLNEFQYVDRLDEVISILNGIRHGEFFKDFANLASGGRKSIFDSRNVWELNDKDDLFYNLGIKELKSRSPIYLPPFTKFVDNNSLSAMYANLEMSYMYDSGHKVTDNELKSIIFSDIGQCVTFFVEDFDKPKKLSKIPDNFFKRLKNVYWDNKKVKKLDGIIYDVIRDITFENSTPPIFTRTLRHCVFYLGAYNALKCDRDVITSDDVVVAYLTYFKIIMADIKLLAPLIDD